MAKQEVDLTLGKEVVLVPDGQGVVNVLVEFPVPGRRKPQRRLEVRRVCVVQNADGARNFINAVPPVGGRTADYGPWVIYGGDQLRVFGLLNDEVLLATAEDDLKHQPKYTATWETF